MPSKDPEKRKAWDRLYKRLRRSGDKTTTPGQLARLTGSQGTAESTPLSEMDERHLRLSRQLQEAAQVIIDRKDASEKDLDIARKLMVDGIKLERLVQGFAPRLTVRPDRSTITEWIFARPEKLDLVHRILEGYEPSEK